MVQGDMTEQCSNSNGTARNITIRDGIEEQNNVTIRPATHSRNPFDGRTTRFTDDLWTFVSVITYIADVGSDLLVCVKYYKEKNFWWFSLTLGFVLAASFAMQLFSAKWLLEDGKRKECFTYLLHVFHLGPVVRYWKVLKSGWKARQKNATILEFAAFLGEWRDISMLRLLQAFLESAPQLVLQLYILLQRPRLQENFELFTAATAAFSLISLVWAILAYSKSLRDFRTQGYGLSTAGLLFQVLWRISIVASRVVAIVLFASYFKQWLFVAVGAHWLMMTTWLICQRTRFCTDEDGTEHPYREKLFSAAIGFMYIFCFFNTREGMTRKRIVLFYSIMLVENSLFVSMWFPHRTFRGTMAVAALGVVWGGFVFGLICMSLYYRFYHPSLPIQGIFLQKRTFDMEGQVTHSWFCCFCCRIRKFTKTSTAVFRDAAEGLIRDVNRSVNHHTACPKLSPPQSQDSSYISGNPCQFMSGLDSNQVLVHSTPIRPLDTCSSYANHPLVTGRLPRILVTGATPEVISPRDSVSNSSLVTLKEIEMEKLDNLARPDLPVSNGDLSATTGAETEKVDPNASKKNCCARRDLRFQDITCTSPKSPTAGEIISWYHPNPTCEASSDAEEERAERINYGSLSFGNRYSLVSSDCISLSSESSRSSVDSIMFADEGPGSSGVHMKKMLSPELTPRTADEGIFSDERDWPSKPTTIEDADISSEASTPQNPRVNNQFPVLVKDSQADTFQRVQSRERTNEWILSSSKPSDESYNLVELLMDAPSSPSNNLKSRTRETGNGLLSEERGCAESKLDFSEEGSGSERMDGHDSESTDASSDSFNFRNRHRSCDEIKTGTNHILSSPDGIKKRHTFDFSQLSKGPRSPRRRRDGKYRRSKRKEFDNFVVTSLKPGKYGSLRRSMERLARIQEDIEETFLLNTEAALNACIPEIEAPSPIEEAVNLNTTITNETNMAGKGLCSTHDSSQRKSDPQENAASLSARESFKKRRRLKRFLSKELVPGKFSSVRHSSESLQSAEQFDCLQENGDIDRGLSSTVSADHLASTRQRVNGAGGREEFPSQTVSLPDVLRSNGNKFEREVIKKPNPNDNRVNSTLDGTVIKNSEIGKHHTGSVPTKRHTYHFTGNSATQTEVQERLLSAENEKRAPETGHQCQRRCQSEVLIGTRNSSVYV